jgi:hypothetical protein
MRAMGPGSVSSLLKIALDVVYVALWILIGGLILTAIVVLFLQMTPAPQVPYHDGDYSTIVTYTGPVAATVAIAIAMFFGIIQFVLAQLRRLFSTLTAGNPFHPDNVRRLRLVGLGLVALEVANIGGHLGAPILFTGTRLGRFPPDVTAWFAIIVVFVLAEVFREGARLRREAELTI